MTAWFQQVFGFTEKSYRDTVSHFNIADTPEGLELLCKANNRKYFVGKFSVNSNEDLAKRLETAKSEYFKKNNSTDSSSAATATSNSNNNGKGEEEQQQEIKKKKQEAEEGENKESVSSASASASASISTTPLGAAKFAHVTKVDVRSISRNPKFADAVIQVASQFNALEHTGPGANARLGISIYANDPTHGPAAVMCCPGALVYRNFFHGGKGQNVDVGGKQINTCGLVEEFVENDKHAYWEMRNGYLLPTTTGTMHKLGLRIGEHDSEFARTIVNKLETAVHWSTEVETSTHHRITQVFSSAVPVNYAKSTTQTDWASFATLVLEGAFTAVMRVAAIRAYELGKRITVFITPVGGGAFGNNKLWLAYALSKALYECRDLPIDVFLAHHGGVAESAFANVGVSDKCPQVPKGIVAQAKRTVSPADRRTTSPTSGATTRSPSRGISPSKATSSSSSSSSSKATAAAANKVKTVSPSRNNNTGTKQTVSPATLKRGISPSSKPKH